MNKPKIGPTDVKLLWSLLMYFYHSKKEILLKGTRITRVELSNFEASYA